MENVTVVRPRVARFDWQGFRYMLTAVLAGGLILSIGLGVEWALIELAKATIEPRSDALSRLFDAIAFGSALAAVILFVLNAIVVIVHYAAWQKESLS
jgi:hypothetical protein